MQTQSAVKIGLVGYGIWGRNILRDLATLGHRVWVADADPAARAAVTGKAEGVVVEARELPDVDALIVATPATSHARVVRELLSRNVPILCEKPLTTDAAEARSLVNAAGTLLFVGHIWCYHPGVEMLAALAKTEELGPVQALRTTRTNWASPRRDVDSVWNLAPHDIALAQFILGFIPLPRFAQAEVVDGRCVGMLGVLGDFPYALFDVSNRFREKRREVRLHCQHGVVVLPDADAVHIEITRTGPARAPLLEQRPIGRESALLRELRVFCDHAAGGPAPRTPASDGLAVVETLETLRRLAGLPTGAGAL